MSYLQGLYAALEAEWRGQHRSSVTIPLMSGILEEELRIIPETQGEVQADHRQCPSDSDTEHDSDPS